MLNYQGVYIEKGKDLEVEWGLQAASYRLSLVIHGQSLWVKNPRYGINMRKPITGNCDAVRT